MDGGGDLGIKGGISKEAGITEKVVEGLPRVKVLREEVIMKGKGGGT